MKFALSLARVGLVVLLASAASAQIVTGSDGSDGAFVFVPDTPGGGTMTIDLGLAATGLDGQGQPITWQTPSPIAGRGVYDGDVWAVVFKYTSVTIASGQLIFFTNHPSRAPVVWLVQQDVQVLGQIRLDSTNGSNQSRGQPGPGGFRGGLQGLSGSHGPGGSASDGAPTYYAICGPPQGSCYGSPACFPLIGGSGATAFSIGSEGGGGALLIAAGNDLSLGAGSALYARGPNVGTGGAIRLVAHRLVRSPTSQILAGPAIRAGRIRQEANVFEGDGVMLGTPTPSNGSPGPLLPGPSTPTLRVSLVELAGGSTLPVPSDPRADTSPSLADVHVPVAGSVTLRVAATNVAPGRTCEVRVLNAIGNATTYVSTPLVGSLSSSTASVQVTLPIGVYAVQAKVNL